LPGKPAKNCHQADDLRKLGQAIGAVKMLCENNHDPRDVLELKTSRTSWYRQHSFHG
jgi:hypothetical protein